MGGTIELATAAGSSPAVLLDLAGRPLASDASKGAAYVALLGTDGSNVASATNPLPVSGAGTPSSAAALTTVAQNAADVTLIAANVARKGLLIVNNSLANLFITYGAAGTITTVNTAIIPSKGTFEMPPPIYTGSVHGIWDAAGAGSANITELT